VATWGAVTAKRTETGPGDSLSRRRTKVAPKPDPATRLVDAAQQLLTRSAHREFTSIGVDNYAEAVQAARLVAKILRGTRLAELPIESVNKLELAINRKTLQAFGATISPALVARAD